MSEKILILEEQEFERFRKYCKERGFDLSYKRGEDIKISRFSSNEKRRAELEREAVNRDSKIVKRQNQKATFYDIAEYEKERWNNAFQEICEEFKEKNKEVKSW
ncbi:MAG: hypothetical protein AUJ31_00510 [Parcubacteria group bacterium CG1_02_39_15]|uniref:Uncharacterized protein n=4 Tax=Candidatus Nealsoniibacteriota TaxID=1817911 RepID=A0A2G9YS49_9BACT|nr:MAG: hypothetical protein AUJ31_00510 [Parcubacteria group bacterium CG1_02_39_15]PIP22059.1 MAG: hypothetical protein COX38_02780 [Candidatus Nealsonbacteria bacterium CG23_combo_of_CG06-09_8_20_14_all_39_25]PIQ98416.1 MAG: hypothetical protein COV64_01380 [Candidatus Nealsonbacteria bacterium CG11_big_fil_rev_8_21_14_0_20_39_9]PIW90471.1 MAG: hypothetical protein COZ92_00655 [Candidatus Nealsonbacteria bacterium CG_4_8_14_3_um_filter_40_11]PIZ88222.1 MAG: hypothetical protein COX91_01320 [